MNDHPVLSHLARFGVHLGLDRMRSFLDAAGNPHKAYPVLHIGGTNGKGSATRMVAEMLKTAGYVTGEYSSPHLQRVNERIRVDGKEIPDHDLDHLLQELDELRTSWGQEFLRGEIQSEYVLTYFEMMTAAALLHFAKVEVDVAVIEVGLGGRLDATNVVEPLVTAITTVGIDHADRLGADTASIASEKGGIIKSEVPVVLGRLPHLARTVCRAMAIDRAAPVAELGVDFRIRGKNDDFMWSGTVLDGESVVLDDLVLAMKGEHQLDNCAVAIAVTKRLPRHLSVPDEAIRRALRTARVSGRLEQLAPDLLVDCAHNIDGAARLAAYLQGLPQDRPRTLLIGTSSDKPIRAMVATLAPCVDRVMTTRCAHPRACEPGELAAALVGVDIPVLPAGPIEQALPSALNGEDLVIVAGSVFLVGAVRDLVGAR